MNAVEACERDAAIGAVERLCAISRSFASKVLPELEALILNFETPMSAKLKLMSVLRYMHGNAKLVQRAFDICLRVMKDYPAADFCVTAIDTVSHLASQSVILVRDVLALLFTQLERDPRKQVKISCLRNITRLSKALSISHVSTFSADILLKQLLECPHIRVHIETLRLFRAMSRSSYTIQKWFTGNAAIAEVR